MSDKIYLGSRLADLDVGEPSLPVSKVILNVDGQTYFQSGDDTGLTVEQDCPWATQAMADSVLEKLKGFVYKPYNGTDALLDPSAELGDALTVGGEYGILAQMGRTLDRQSAATVGAPGTDEIEDEYPYKSKQRKEIDRVLAKSYSRISKTAEEIRLEIQNEVEGLSSSISLTLEEFSASINGLEGDFAELSLTLDGLTVTDDEGTTKIKGSSIETETLYVDAANVTGTLKASQINLTGAITWEDLASDAQSEIDAAQTAASNAYGIASSAYNASENALSGLKLLADGQYSGGSFIDGTNIYAPNLYGDTITLLDGSSHEVGTMSLKESSTYAFDLTSNLSLRLQCAAGFNAFLGNGWSSESGLSAGILADGAGALVLYGKLGATAMSYGESLPTSGYNGQIYFLLEG